MLATIHLPETMAKLVEKVAQASKSSHETVLLEWLEHPIGYPNHENFDSFLERMDALSNIQLWTLVYRQVPDEEEARYQVIYEKHEAGEVLSEKERETWREIADLGLIFGTVRLNALLVLQARGEDVEELLPQVD